MKTLAIILAFSIYMVSNNSAGPGGDLLDNSAGFALDCCGGKLFAR